VINKGRDKPADEEAKNDPQNGSADRSRHVDTPLILIQFSECLPNQVTSDFQYVFLAAAEPFIGRLRLHRTALRYGGQPNLPLAPWGEGGSGNVFHDLGLPDADDLQL
jgi:hypothetical protein